MTQELFRSYDAQIDSVLEGERAVVARVNTAAVDRLRTVIDPMGCDVSHFNKTRSVLWNHGQDPIRGTVPIGQGWVKVRRSEGDILGKTTFAKDDFSEQLFQGYKEGSIRGWSIKAGVHDASPPTKEEIRSRPDLADCEMVYRKWDLIEFSATPTPGNSDCLTMLVSRGLITAPEGFVPSKPEQAGVVEKPIVRTEPYIEESGGLWVVRNADGTSCVTLKDKSIAEDVLRLMLAEPPRDSRQRYHAEAAQMLAETRRMFGDIGTEIKEYIDLYRHGRI